MASTLTSEEHVKLVDNGESESDNATTHAQVDSNAAPAATPSEASQAESDSSSNTAAKSQSNQQRAVAARSKSKPPVHNDIRQMDVSLPQKG
jgi:hypothetical protein